MAVATLPQYRFTVKQYHRMIETGVLNTNERVELLEGRIVPKMPHNPPHDGTISLIHKRVGHLLPDEWLIRIQSAITTRESEPEPDLAVVSGPELAYLTRHPGPDDIGLLIEVANTTLQDDRIIKGGIYARARIQPYWIVNLIDFQIEVYSDPRGGKIPGYRHRKIYRAPESIPLIVVQKNFGQIPVKDILPEIS
jgi:Uma2 family endonuclease